MIGLGFGVVVIPSISWIFPTKIPIAMSPTRPRSSSTWSMVILKKGDNIFTNSEHGSTSATGELVTMPQMQKKKRDRIILTIEIFRSCGWSQLQSDPGSGVFLSSLPLVTPVWVRRDIYNLNFWWGPLLDKYTFLASHWKYWKNISFATHTRVHQNRVIYPTHYSNNWQQRRTLGLG